MNEAALWTCRPVDEGDDQKEVNSATEMGASRAAQTTVSRKTRFVSITGLLVHDELDSCVGQVDNA